MLFNSIASLAAGSIKRVTVYLSNLGKQMLKRHETQGPDVFYDKEEYQKLQKMKQEREEAEVRRRVTRFVKKEGKSKKFNPEKHKLRKNERDVDEIDEGLNPLKIRAYELDRLKYYFGVVECDSVATASRLYEECDGYEFESTGVVMDLRYIPDDVRFEKNEVLNSCDKLPEEYKPKQHQVVKVCI